MTELPGALGWTDAHCHLQDRYVDAEGADAEGALRGALDRAAAAGVTRAVCVGTDPATSAAAIRLSGLAGLAVEMFATVGLHPHEASSGTSGLEEVLDADAASRVVAVGECGLDYYYEHSPRDAQLVALAEQARLATERGLALVLHVRDAFDDLFGVLGDVGIPERTVVHCFTGGPGEATRCLDAGMALSISGIVTFKNAAELREAVALAPLDRLMVETDSPFLAPVPLRGRVNEPANVVLVGEAVADLLGVAPEVVREATSRTTARMFGLPDPL